MFLFTFISVPILILALLLGLWIKKYIIFSSEPKTSNYIFNNNAEPENVRKYTIRQLNINDLRQNSKILIVGKRGSGKSILVQHLLE